MVVEKYEKVFFLNESSYPGLNRSSVEATDSIDAAPAWMQTGEEKRSFGVRAADHGAAVASVSSV